MVLKVLGQVALLVASLYNAQCALSCELQQNTRHSCCPEKQSESHHKQSGEPFLAIGQEAADAVQAVPYYVPVPVSADDAHRCTAIEYLAVDLLHEPPPAYPSPASILRI